MFTRLLIWLRWRQPTLAARLLLASNALHTRRR